MKKIKILLTLIGLFPLMLNASANEEVKWRWYTLIEEDIHYEKNVENICEDLEKIDKDKFIYGEWIYSIEKPEEIDNREIVEIDKELNIRREINSFIKLEDFNTNNSNIIKIYEIKIYNQNEENIEYEIIKNNISGNVNNINDQDLNTFINVNKISNMTLKLKTPENFNGLKIVIDYEKNDDFKGVLINSYLNETIYTNGFATYSTINKKSCNDNICTFEQKIKNVYSEPLKINTKVYKYRDKYFKCYKEKRLYVPGYFDDLEGFIKDELLYVKKTINNNDNKTEVKTDNTNNKKEDKVSIKENIINKETPLIITTNKEKEPQITKELKEKKENVLTNTIAMVDENKEDEFNIKIPIILGISILVLIVTFVYIKKVGKSRSN